MRPRCAADVSRAGGRRDAAPERRRRDSRRSSTSGPTGRRADAHRTSPGATATTASRRWPSIRCASTSTGRSPTTPSPRRAPGWEPRGERAWLNLRVYDITGRLFDGTNAHSYFDHRVERHERQWFFGIDKPTSAACAEIGLRSEEGYFVKIARSGRVEFPRREPVGGGGVEWLSVRGAQRRAAYAGGAPGGGARGVGPGPAGGGGGAPGGGGDQPPAMTTGRTGPTAPASPSRAASACSGAPGSGRKRPASSGPATGPRPNGSGPCCAREWEAGPFTYPVDVPEGSIEVQDNGEVSVRSEGGRTHVMYGPWQVVIRGIGARAERRVLGTWEYRRQIAVEGGVERDRRRRAAATRPAARSG